MAASGQLHVIPQNAPVFRMRAVVDDGFGPLHRALAAQIGHALLGHDDLDRVFAVIHVAHERHDGADLSAFRGGRAGEDGKERVPRKIARAADAVHHAPAQHMGAVHVAGDVDLDGGVDGDDAQAPHDFGAVADLLRPEHEFGAEKLQVRVNVLQRRVRDGERTAAGEPDLARAHQVDHGILDHFRVHLEDGDAGVFAHGFQHGVRGVAHA